MSGIDLAAVWLGVAIAAFISGGAGFGFAILSAPLVALVEPGLIPEAVIISSISLNLLVATRDRRGLEIGLVSWALVGAAPGSVGGALVVVLVPEETLAVLLGVVIIVLAAVSAVAPRFEPSRPVLVVAGLVSGVAGTATSIGGPPIALALQHRTGADLRGTLAAYFMATSVLALALLAAFGELGTREVGVGLLLVPAVVVGFSLSSHVARLLDRGHTRRVVLAFSTLSATALLVRHVL